MGGVKLKVFHCGISSLQSLFNEWVSANPKYQIVDIKVTLDPNASPEYAGDIILLVFYYPA